MYKRFFEMDFGLQMIVTVFTLILLNPLMGICMSLTKMNNEFLFYCGLVLVLMIFVLQCAAIVFGIISIVKLLMGKLK